MRRAGGTALLVLATVMGWSQGASPRITFTFDFPQSEPAHYVLSVTADGQARYESSGKISPEAESSDPFVFEFVMSPQTRTQVFDLAGRVHYFADDLDSHKKGLASTGTKTLAYENGTTTHQSTYNYSTKAPVQTLTALLQGVSSTLEFARRLDYYHRYQKLALDDELKTMESMSKNGGLAELQALAPILRQLAVDTTLINPVRARAQRMLVQAGVADNPREP